MLARNIVTAITEKSTVDRNDNVFCNTLFGSRTELTTALVIVKPKEANPM